MSNKKSVRKNQNLKRRFNYGMYFATIISMVSYAMVLNPLINAGTKFNGSENDVEITKSNDCGNNGNFDDFNVNISSTFVTTTVTTSTNTTVVTTPPTTIPITTTKQQATTLVSSTGNNDVTKVIIPESTSIIDVYVPEIITSISESTSVETFTTTTDITNVTTTLDDKMAEESDNATDGFSTNVESNDICIDDLDEEEVLVEFEEIGNILVEDNGKIDISTLELENIDLSNVDISNIDYDTIDLSEFGISYDEYVILCNVVGHEYGSDCISVSEKALVVEVVMNRVNSSKYPNTIFEVLTQYNQFYGVFSYVYLGDFSYQVTDSVKMSVAYYFYNQDKYCHNYLSFYGDGKRNYFS